MFTGNVAAWQVRVFVDRYLAPGPNLGLHMFSSRYYFSSPEMEETHPVTTYPFPRYFTIRLTCQLGRKSVLGIKQFYINYCMNLYFGMNSDCMNFPINFFSCFYDYTGCSMGLYFGTIWREWQTTSCSSCFWRPSCKVSGRKPGSCFTNYFYYILLDYRHHWPPLYQCEQYIYILIV